MGVIIVLHLDPSLRFFAIDRDVDEEGESIPAVKRE